MRLVSKCEMWFEKYDSDLFFTELLKMIYSRDHAWSSHRQFFSDRLISFFDEWRMLILDYRVTYVCFRFVERCLWWNVKLNEAFNQIWNETTYKIWRKRFIKFDEKNVISSNVTKVSSHQTLKKKHNFSTFW